MTDSMRRCAWADCPGYVFSATAVFCPACLQKELEEQAEVEDRDCHPVWLVIVLALLGGALYLVDRLTLARIGL